MSVKRNTAAAAPSPAMQTLKADLKAGDGSLTLEEERKLRNDFKALSSVERQAATKMIEHSGFGNLAAQLKSTQPPADGVAAGQSTQDGGKASATGAITAQAWQNPGPEVLGRLTQNGPPGLAGAESGPSRCGPANVLAGAIMNGPESTANVLDRAADAKGNTLEVLERARLKQISADVKGGKATFEQLNEAQNLLYRSTRNTMSLRQAMDMAEPGLKSLPKADQEEFQTLQRKTMDKDGLNRAGADRMGALLTRATGVPTQVVDGPNNSWAVKITAERFARGQAGGLSDEEMQRLGRNTGTLTTGATRDTSPVFDGQTRQDNTLGEMMARLKPGQSATFRVAATENDDAHHYISVGKDKSGRPWIYNPDPTRDDHTFFHGVAGKVQPDNFRAELARYDRRNPSGDTGYAPVITLQAP